MIKTIREKSSIDFSREKAQVHRIPFISEGKEGRKNQNPFCAEL